MVTACIGLHSCLFQQDDYFDKSSAERAAADVIKCSELLKSSPNGWLLEYYIGSGYAMGGITLLCKFDDKKVTMASTLSTPNVPSGVFIESLYQVVSEQSTMLTFDSYNELIHALQLRQAVETMQMPTWGETMSLLSWMLRITRSLY